MNPDNDTGLVSTLSVEQVVKQPHPVNQITPVSKCLAMIFFVLLPFVGGYIGWRLSTVNNQSDSASVLPSVEKTPRAREESEVKRRLVDAVSEIKYLDMLLHSSTSLNTTLFYISELPGYEYTTIDLGEIENIVFKDLQALIELQRKYDFSSSPNKQDAGQYIYLKLIYDSGDELVFTSNCFIGSECGDQDLFRYNKNDKTLRTSNVSEYYIDEKITSPDGSKVPIVDQSSGFKQISEIAYLDLASDSYVIVDQLGDYQSIDISLGMARQDFAYLKWLSNSSFELSIITNYDSKKDCVSTSERGIYGCKENFSTTTVRYDIPE